MAAVHVGSRELKSPNKSHALDSYSTLRWLARTFQANARAGLTSSDPPIRPGHSRTIQTTTPSSKRNSNDGRRHAEHHRTSFHRNCTSSARTPLFLSCSSYADTQNAPPAQLTQENNTGSSSAPSPPPSPPPPSAPSSSSSSSSPPFNNIQHEKPTGSSTRTPIHEQLSVGTILGLATGYSIRKIGRILAFVVGTEIIILQYLAYKQWLVMDWQRVANDLRPRFNRSTWDAGMEIILYKLPFVTAFSAGLAAGLRISK